MSTTDNIKHAQINDDTTDNIKHAQINDGTTDNIKHAQINNKHHRQYKTCTDKQ
jgi:hypothetical protein